jgi:hypothetical protein
MLVRVLERTGHASIWCSRRRSEGSPVKKERLEKEKLEAVAGVASDPTRQRVLQAAFDAFQERG